MKKRFVLFWAVVMALSLPVALAGKTPSKALRVASYNIRGNQERDGINQWQFRRDSLCKIIVSYGFKVVGLQEAVPDQLEDIVRITGYSWVGEPGLNDPIIYDASRIELLDWGMFWLNEKEIPHEKSWDGKYERYCTWAVLRDRKTHKRFKVFNTHLDHRGIVAREKGAERICEKAASLGGALPTIVMGDMNSWDNTAAYRTLAAHYSDARAVSPLVFGPRGTAHNFGGVHPVRIDYFFVDPRVRIYEYNALDIVYGNDDFFPSDHYPIYIDVTFK